MRRTTVLVLAGLAVLPVLAFAQTSPPTAGQMNAGDWPRGASCQQMKERLDAVMGSGSSRSGSADTGAANPNNSGITARTREARRHIALGDRACEAGAMGEARSHYQKAYDSFMSSQ